MTQDINQSISSDELTSASVNLSTQTNVKFIDITVNKATILSDLGEIYLHLYPDTNLNKLILKELTEGVLNCMYKCYHEDQNPDDALIIRLFNFRLDLSEFIGEGESPQNRQLEFESMCIGSGLDICAKVYARFHNGLVYSFIPGQTLQLDQVQDIELGKLVAVQVARMHTMAPESLPANQSIHDPESAKTWLERMQPKIDKSPVEEFKSLPKLLEINSWIEDLRSRLVRVGLGEMGFCHNDLNLSNIVYNEKTKVVKILDFEWADRNYNTVIDIAIHFASFAGFFLQDFDPKLLPSQEFQLQWIRHYMQELNRLKGREMDDDEFDKICQTLLIKINIYMQIVKLNYVVRAPCALFLQDKEPEMSNNKDEQDCPPNNAAALYSLKALAGYRMDKERTENLLKQLEQELI